MRSVRMRNVERDHVEHIIEQWQRERPEIDVSPMGVIARISRLSRLLEREIEEGYAQSGLNQAQFGVLAALRRAGRPYCLSPTSLYNSLLISSGAMTNRLERLRAAGLVERIADPADGRSVLVALTPKGKRLIDRVVARHYENERRLLAALTPAERETLSALLRKLLLGFEDVDPPETARTLPPAASNGRSSRRPPAGSARSRTRPPGTRGS